MASLLAAIFTDESAVSSIIAEAFNSEHVLVSFLSLSFPLFSSRHRLKHHSAQDLQCFVAAYHHERVTRPPCGGEYLGSLVARGRAAPVPPACVVRLCDYLCGMPERPSAKPFSFVQLSCSLKESARVSLTQVPRACNVYVPVNSFGA